MAISRLAISNPGATTDTLLYTADRSSLVSIIATNKASTVAEVRVWVVPQGQDATPANWSYIAYDADITATNSLETFRFPVMTGDKIYVRSTTADVSFQIMGIYETGADTYVYAQAAQPTAPQIGDIWVDTASNVPSIDNTTVYRWSKTAVGGETSLSGTGNDLSTLQYIAGYEQVYLNGVLLAKGLDYTASNGTSITSLLALTAGDIVEVISPYAIELTDIYTKSQVDAKSSGYTTCTSTTRPLSPYTGQKIYETDKKASLTWDGTQWTLASRPGEILERISSVCDGSSVVGYNGTYTFQNVTGAQNGTDSYVDITGSTLAYNPPPGTKQVIYRFEFTSSWNTAGGHAISHYKFFIDGVEATLARHSRSAQYQESRYAFEWVMNIGGSNTPSVGRFSTWSGSKTLKMMFRRYTSINQNDLHRTTYWDAATTSELSIPVLTIEAIG